MTSISCLLPAYNEENTIVQTIELILPLIGNELQELIIINDASTDTTGKLLKRFKNIKALHIIHNTKNLWKSWSIAQALQQVKSSHILLLDADLEKLDTKDILALISPIQERKARVSMGFIKNARPLFPFKKIDYCSGQRVLPTKLFKGEIENLARLPRYGLEVFINQLMIRAQTPISIVHRPEVENTFHHNKAGRWAGRKKNITIRKDIIKIAGGIKAIYKMNRELEKLLTPNPK